MKIHSSTEKNSERTEEKSEPVYASKSGSCEKQPATFVASFIQSHEQSS